MCNNFSPTNTAVIGLQFGDEGKGQVVDRLTEDHDVVVRFAALAARDLVGDGDVAAFTRLKRSAEGRAVPLPGTFVRGSRHPH